MKQLLLFLSLCLFCTGCKKNENNAQLSSDPEITKKINELYAVFGHSNEELYRKQFPKDLFSSDLQKILENAIDTSTSDIENVKKSDHPTDKPLLLEGAVFSSLYEGYTSYTIQSIHVIEDAQGLGTAADVKVGFEYTLDSPKIVWTDTVRLIKVPKDGWRIDNINFDNKMGGSKNLKTSLGHFISGTE